MTIDGQTENAVIVKGYVRHWATGAQFAKYWVHPRIENASIRRIGSSYQTHDAGEDEGLLP